MIKIYIAIPSKSFGKLVLKCCKNFCSNTGISDVINLSKYPLTPA